MPTIQILDTGLIYRNPQTYLKSVHAYFPSVITMANGEMLASLVLGEAFEAVNAHTYLARSRDAGKNWTLEGRLCQTDTPALYSDAARLSYLDNQPVAFWVRSNRTDHPDHGLTNPDTLGFVPTDLFILKSPDQGKSWSVPQSLNPPLVGPAFELCAPIVALPNGTWVLSTSTWCDWKGYAPNGFQQVALFSDDKGKTWPRYASVMNDPQQNIIHWESKIICLSDNTLFTAAWGYDRKCSCDLPNQYAFSSDLGKTWSAPQSLNIFGQTLTPYALSDGRILLIYRRVDEPGLWATIAEFPQRQCRHLQTVPLWGQRQAGLTGTSESMVQNFQNLRFGAPCINQAPDGSIFLAFWCYEDYTSNIRWFKLNVS